MIIMWKFLFGFHDDRTGTDRWRTAVYGQIGYARQCTDRFRTGGSVGTGRDLSLRDIQIFMRLQGNFPLWIFHNIIHNHRAHFFTLAPFGLQI